jgi:hypothetical protein
MAKSPKPVTPGRMVNYVMKRNNVAPAEILPAVTVTIKSTETDDTVGMHVFPASQGVIWKENVSYSDTKEPGTWHWPEIK